jgi:hypothetical protein
MTQPSRSTDNAPVARRTGRALFAALLRALAFAAGFALVAAALGRTLPPPDDLQVTAKLRHLQQNRGRYDLLFFGSSRVLRHFIPANFDAALAAAGHSVHSFNFGLDAMPPPESFYVIRQALARHPGVRWIFVELWDIRTVGNERSLATQRFVAWHDLRHTAIVLHRLCADDRLNAGEKFARAVIHLRAALARFSTAGRGAALLRPALDPPRRKKGAKEEAPSWLATQGFFPGAEEIMHGPKRDAFEAAVRAIRTSMPLVELPPDLRRDAAVLAREIRASGAVPVFIVMPTVNGGENFVHPRTQGIDAECISLVSPEKFALLYDPDRHNDDWHLTGQGARDFTRILGEEFRALLEVRAASSQPPAQ